MAKDSKVISPYASDRSSSCLVCAASARERARTARLGEPGGGAPGPHLVALALRDRLAQPRVAKLPEYFVEELLALVDPVDVEEDALPVRQAGLLEGHLRLEGVSCAARAAGLLSAEEGMQAPLAPALLEAYFVPAMSYGSLPVVPDEPQSPASPRRRVGRTLTGGALVCVLLACARQAVRTTATALAARTPVRDAAVQGDGLVLASSIVNTTMPLVAECTLELSGRYWIQVRERAARARSARGFGLCFFTRIARRRYPGTRLMGRAPRCGPSGANRRTRACSPYRFTWRSCGRTRNTRSRCGRRRTATRTARSRSSSC